MDLIADGRAEPRAASEAGIDEIFRIFDGGNIMLHDCEGVVRRWTSGCEALYGWPRGEAVGRSLDTFLYTEYPLPLEEILEAIEARGAWEGEILRRRRDGRAVVVATRWVATVVGDEATPVVIETDVDVTALRTAQENLEASESHLRSILDTVPEAMAVIDEAGVITSFSAAAERLFGYTSEEACGRNVSMLMPSPDRENHDRYIGNYLRSGVPRIIGYGRVVTGLRKDGTTFPMELAVGEAVANGSRIFTGFIRDLTSRHRMEEELRQAQKMEAVGQLTGGIAHDFNNLLTVVGGNLEMMERRVRDSAALELLAEAQAAVADGAKLTEHLLAFGRRQPLNPRLVDVGELVDRFAGLLRRTLGETVELRTAVTGTSQRARIDTSQFQNALLNLALNARDAMPGGGRLTVEVTRSRLDPDYARMYPEVRTGTYVLVTVTDTGVGMTAEVRRRAFEPFFTTKGVGSGTGLGLSMVYGFVKQSGGHVQIYSEVGRGTSIRLFLPAADAVAGEAEEDDLRPGAAEAVRGGSEAILVVEDDARVRRVAVARLADAGYRVLEAENAAAALALLPQHPEIRLVFTDIVMPGGIDGTALAREVRALRPETKVLYTSGYSEPAISGRELSAGELWLRKPYTAVELARALRELLD